MTIYQNFIGIDIGKFNFVVAIHGNKNSKEYTNNADGIHKFIVENKPILSRSLCIIETTGGYEMKLLLTLYSNGISIHRANTRKVKNFIYSYGNRAKTDRLDSRALALYGFERHSILELFVPKSEIDSALYELVGRRNDLKQMLTAEKNRLQAPRTNLSKSSCQIMIKTISDEIKSITSDINNLIECNELLRARKEVIKSIPGVGDIVANELLVLLPEAGYLNRRQIASLAGLAPRSNESGVCQGYRKIAHGRDVIKPILFLAAMAARNSNSELRRFYEKLISNGKKKKVALVALMRKIVVIANAKLRDLAIQNMAIKI